jgi:hypothetical protein
MEHSKSVITLVVVTAGLAMPLSALAENCGGRFNNVATHAETMEVGKGLSVTSFSARSSSTSENSDFNGVGACAGYVLVMPDGKARAVGVCARKNKDGDSYSDEWGLEPGAQRGWWKISAGTGVFAGKVGTAGWWRPLVDDGKVTMGSWGCN